MKMKMSEQVKKALEPFKQFWTNTTPLVRKLIIGGTAAVLTVAVILSFLLNTKDYVVIFDDLPQTENQEILAKLHEMKVDTKLEQGAILVLKEDEARIRMALATEGYPKNGLSYYLIEQNSGVLTTDYERKQYENMQRQERIAASIRTLEGVKDAVVTITIPNDNGFYLQQKDKSSASVIIHMKQGSTLTESQIFGIQNLVARSVSGLNKENIALSDGGGNDLTASNTSNKAELSKITVTREIENDIKKKIMAVLDGPYEQSQVKVSVTATVNTDALIREETTYMPSQEGNNSGVISEETREEESSSSNQSDGGVAGTSTNAEVPTYPIGGSSGGSDTSKSSENIRYQVSQTKSQLEKSGAVIEAISIGIAVDKADFDPGERESIVQLVSFAAGVGPENVAVQNFRFQARIEAQEIAKEETGLHQWMIYALAGAVLLCLLLGMTAVVVVKGRRKRGEEEALRREMEQREEMQTSENQRVLNEIFGETAQEEIMLPPIEPIHDARQQQIKDFARVNPEIAAQMIKNWLRSESEM